MRTLVALIPLFLLACSKQGVYEAVQNGQKLECDKYYGSEYDKCVSQYSKSYDDYERDRQE